MNIQKLTIETKENAIKNFKISNENFEIFDENEGKPHKITKRLACKISFNENFEDLNKEFDENDLKFKNENSGAGRSFAKELDEISGKYFID